MEARDIEVEVPLQRLEEIGSSRQNGELPVPELLPEPHTDRGTRPVFPLRRQPKGIDVRVYLQPGVLCEIQIPRQRAAPRPGRFELALSEICRVELLV